MTRASLAATLLVFGLQVIEEWSSQRLAGRFPVDRSKDLLSRRLDLRLILMSATLNAELFSSYFGGAPTINIPGFTHPVRAHFLEYLLERTGYNMTASNQLDDYGQDKLWKTRRWQLILHLCTLSSFVSGVTVAMDLYSGKEPHKAGSGGWK